jgi:hypothetical protein
MKTKYQLFVVVVCSIGLLLASHARAQSLETAQQALEQIAHAEKLWETASLDSYELTVRYSAFTLEYGCAVQSFRVVNNRARPLASRKCKSRPDVLGTVPALFRLARKELIVYSDEVVFSFDPESGYPVEFYCGFSDMDDAYFAFEIVKFEPLESAK